MPLGFLSRRGALLSSQTGHTVKGNSGSPESRATGDPLDRAMLSEPANRGSIRASTRTQRRGYGHFRRTQLPRVAQELVTALLSWGDEHDELYAIGREFQHLRQGLKRHLDEEERDVFPLLRRLKTASTLTDSAAAVSPGPAALLGRLEQEHGETLESLRIMRGLVSDYRVAEGSCLECAGLYRQLGALETDIERHIHLEDDVLITAMRRLTGIW